MPYFNGHLTGSEDDHGSGFDRAAAKALRDLRDAADDLDASWALIGSLALRAYGVPRTTLDVENVLSAQAGALATQLVNEYNWLPLLSAEADKYSATDQVFPHFMDDKVLFDVHQQRVMFPLQSTSNIIVELLTAQHPIEQEMTDVASIKTFEGERIWLAPLGGILLVKTKADRDKDRLAIYQTVEHLPTVQLRAAVDWAAIRDPATAEDLDALISETKARLVPRSIGPALPVTSKPKKKR